MRQLLLLLLTAFALLARVVDGGGRSKGPSGEGSVYQRKSDGKWVGAVTLPSGRRKVVYGKDEAEAMRKRRQLLRDVELGRPAPPRSAGPRPWASTCCGGWTGWPARWPRGTSGRAPATPIGTCSSTTC